MVRHGAQCDYIISVANMSLACSSREQSPWAITSLWYQHPWTGLGLRAMLPPCAELSVPAKQQHVVTTGLWERRTLG